MSLRFSGWDFVHVVSDNSSYAATIDCPTGRSSSKRKACLNFFKSLLLEPPEGVWWQWTAEALAKTMSKQEVRYFRQAARQVLGVDSPTILGITHHAYCQLSKEEEKRFDKRFCRVLQFCNIALNGDTPYRYGRKKQ